MSKTALITGASGLLGRQVVKAFNDAGWTVVGTGLTRANPPAILKVDLTNRDDIEKALDEAKPHVVVHCAAQRFPDKVDADPEGARSLNIDASRTLAHACSSRSIFLLYISTDYVFPGRPGDAPYASSATPAPTNLYGQTKLDGERVVLEETGKSGLGAVLRVPVLYGPAHENKESAVNVLWDAVWKAQKEDVSMDAWAIRYPTHTEDVGRVCRDVAERFLAAADEKERQGLEKVLQFSSEDKMTKYEICEAMADVLGLGLGNMKANKEGNDPNASVQRPYDCHLSTQALKHLGVDVRTQDFKAFLQWQAKAYKK